MRIAKRITVKSGKLTRKVLIIDPPWPERDDVLTFDDGSDWIVARIKDERVLARFSNNSGKLKQVFP